MSPAERKVTVLAVAPWGVSAVFLTALLLVPGDGWSPVSVALAAAALAMSCAGAAPSHRLKRHLSPALYGRYELASNRALFVCGVVVFLNYVATAEADTGRGEVLGWGYTVLWVVMGLFPTARRRSS